MAATTKFEVYQDKKGEWRWRLLAKNGEAVATGEGYAVKRACMNAVAKLREWAATDIVAEVTPGAKKAPAKKVAKKVIAPKA